MVATGKLLFEEAIEALKIELAARAADALHAAARASYRRVFGRDWPEVLDSGPGAAAVKVLIPAILRTAADIYGDALPYTGAIKSLADLALRGVTRRAVEAAMPFLGEVGLISAGLLLLGSTTPPARTPIDLRKINPELFMLQWRAAPHGDWIARIVTPRTRGLPPQRKLRRAHHREHSLRVPPRLLQPLVTVRGHRLRR